MVFRTVTSGRLCPKSSFDFWTEFLKITVFFSLKHLGDAWYRSSSVSCLVSWLDRQVGRHPACSETSHNVYMITEAHSRHTRYETSRSGCRIPEAYSRHTRYGTSHNDLRFQWHPVDLQVERRALVSTPRVLRFGILPSNRSSLR